MSYQIYDYQYFDKEDNEYIFTVEYCMRPAERDVGIMSPWVDFDVMKIVEVETDKEVNEDLFLKGENVFIAEWLSNNSDIDLEIEEHERSEWEYTQEKRAERIAENNRLRRTEG